MVKFLNHCNFSLRAYDGDSFNGAAKMQLRVRRARWIINGQVVEQDAYSCTPDEWAAIVRETPSFATWAVFRFGDQVTAVSFPLGVTVGSIQLGAHV